MLFPALAAAVDIVYGKGQRRPKGRADYVLYCPLQDGAEPIPMAIIETKHEGLPPEHGLQQGKSYRIGKLHDVPFVYSSNGHQFVEYDVETGLTSEARPMSEFPTPEEPRQRYLEKRQLPTAAKEIQPLTREQRAARFGEAGPDWLIRLPQPTAKVIRAMVRQFERAGTAALETTELWNTPELRELKGRDVLKQSGQSAELLRQTKETLFAA